MKTPSLPLLALAAALSPNAAGAVDAPHRCAADWLKKTTAAVQRGGIPDNQDKSLREEKIENGTRWVVDFDAPSFPCDGALRHYLVVNSPGPYGDLIDPKTGKPVGGTAWKWSDDGFKQAWNLSLDQQVRILQASDDMYSFVDPRGLAVLKAADEVVDAAVALGVAVKKADAAGITAVKTANLTGSAFAGLPVYTVIPPAAAPADAKPDELKAALTGLLKDKPGKDPKTSTLAPGPKVLAFRAAIIDLADELAVRAGGRELLAKNGVDAAAKFDFVAGAKVAAFKALGNVKGAAESPALAPSILEKDADYQNALKYLVGAEPIKDGADVSTHDSAALSRLDYGLRNLIATRAAAADAALDLAKTKLKGTTVKATLAAVGRTDAPSTTAPPDLAAGVLAKLNANPDFAKLNQIFDNKHTPSKEEAAWAASPEGVAARQQRDQLIANAQATRLEGGRVIYRDGKPGTAAIDLPLNVRVPALSNADYRNLKENEVMLAILQGNPINAKLLAVIDAFKGTQVVADIPPKDAKLPPPVVVVKPTKSAWQTILSAVPAPGPFDFFTAKDARAETYLSAERTKAAEDAAAASRARMEATRKAVDARDAVTRKCDEEKAEIAARPADPFLSAAAAQKWRSSLAEAKNAECERRIREAYDNVIAGAKLADPAVVTRTKTEREAAAEATVKQAYVEAIKESVDELHKEYKTVKNDRAQKAASESGFGSFYGKHLDLVDGYFTKDWDGAALPGSTKTCTDSLWHPSARLPNRRVLPASFKDPTVDNVDDLCVHGNLVKHLQGYIGKGDVAK